ncbi:hypothetical protein A3J90_05355 [candidate division WOR-1 bacterium RIFOXYC2_FULL_37_10]|uniref:DUF86 domain-containing protein n=1 Tax=candidate division WOR-1 bacterium RIFOXYB2_FULL_37_13 TaxID=1802579 RepID=A0A1F4SUW3_UNCSA|nr:MAG: hypothetical protein A2310_06695 [candidate division WOR-1 bacterium RIFOXYB2_FULL_37_13]OGC36461.1 MAG: hypothetical protein A3J90_05355 [candidate division WOR-1 bacterium RIFOXYC2_FULL_37_10]
MILRNDQVEDIVRRIDFIKIQLDDLKQFTSLDWDTYRKNRDVQRNVERLAENVANAAIDVCKILLASENIEMPNSYKEVILKLGQMNILKTEESEKIAGYASLRNILAHQYLDLRWDKIKKFIANAHKDFEIFTDKVNKKIFG